MSPDRIPTPGAWDTAWEGTPSWETGRPQPVVERLVADGVFGEHQTVLDVGCGSGRHAVLVARTGASVVGIDVAAAAVERAWAYADVASELPPGAGPRRRTPRRLAVSFATGDALDLGTLGPAIGAPFDAALDVGLFHVLQPDDQARYAEALAAVIRPGGRAFVVAWSDRNPFGIGPGRITRRALRTAFATRHGWRVDEIEATSLATNLAMGEAHAWLARLTRR